MAGVVNMESPGEHLKRERELREVSLLKIFESTRVPMKYLEAIEADRIEGLPHPAFVKGFIRSYCKVLGLDENDAVLRYEVWLADMAAEAEGAGKAQGAQEARPKKAPAPQRPAASLPPYLGKLIVIGVGIVIVVLAYSLTRRDLSAPEPQAPSPAPVAETLSEPTVEPSTVTPAAQVPMKLPEPTEPPEPNVPLSTVSPAPNAPMKLPEPAEPSVPLSTVFVGSVPQSAPQLTPPVPAMTVPAHKSVPEPVVKPASPVAQPVPPAAQPVQKTPQAEPVKKEAPAAVDGAVKKEEQPVQAHTLVVSARDTVWLKVAVDKGSPVEVLLKQGERFTWKAAESISVIIGNAGGVTVNYNGKDMKGLGAQGEVVGLNLPSGQSYKIKKTQPAIAPQAPVIAPQPSVPPPQSPAINMPEIPVAPQQANPAE